jgi:predicted RNase H-like nuclease (RuvC/YqgF family)
VCTQCSKLEFQIKKLSAENKELKKRIELLESWVAWLVKKIKSVRNFCRRTANGAHKKREKGGLAPFEYHRLLGVLQTAKMIERKLRIE